MRLSFETVSIKNFLSFGNVEQTINLQDKKYQIILGQNKDKSDSDDDKNGVGKSTIFEAIHYALFGKSIGNKITLSSLINNINKKNMGVTLTFKKDDTTYTIIRGRSPNVLKFFVNGEDKTVDETQGDSRNTQEAIESVLGINEEVFDQLVCLSCKVPMYYNQSTTNQKMILEKILGIDVITKKIEALKELIKDTKNDFNNEQFKVVTLKKQNEQLQQACTKQYDDMVAAKTTWENDLLKQIADIAEQIDEMKKIDIDEELNCFKRLEEYVAQERENNTNVVLKGTLVEEQLKNNRELEQLERNAKTCKTYDFEAERQAIQHNEVLDKLKIEYDATVLNHLNHKREKERLEKTLKEVCQKAQKKIDEEKKLSANVCPTCGKPLDEDKVEEMRSSLKAEIKELTEEAEKITKDIEYEQGILDSFEEKSFIHTPTRLKTMSELIVVENEAKQIDEKIAKCKSLQEELDRRISEIVIKELGEKPVTHYTTLQDALQHQAKLDNMSITLESLKKQLETNPFEQQEKSIEELRTNIKDVDETVLKDLEKRLNNQNVLLKLLNSPTSFIRKTILQRSLEFLNNKIKEYLIKLGSMDIVSFNDDMTMTINRLGINYGYVSSGEEGRISLALMLAFRDVWETLNNCSINLMAFDEIIDRIGLDTAGVECAIKAITGILDKNVFIVTHNDSLISRTKDTIKLIKKHGFTTIGETNG